MPRPKAKSTPSPAPAPSVPPEGTASNDDLPLAKTREELVREAAYRRYQARGGQHGGHEQDWLDAEAEVRPPEGN